MRYHVHPDRQTGGLASLQTETLQASAKADKIVRLRTSPMLLEGTSPHIRAGVPACSRLVAICEPDKPTKVLALLRSVDDLGVVQ